MKKIILYAIVSIAFFNTHAQTVSVFPDTLNKCKCHGDSPDTTIIFEIRGSAKYSHGALVKCFGGCTDFFYLKKANGWIDTKPLYDTFASYDICVYPRTGFFYLVSNTYYYKFTYENNKFTKKGKLKFEAECLK